MSAQNTASIQTLLEAEKDAQQIVEKARQYRTQRLKDARSEAQKEIDKYKSKKESEFKEYESKVSLTNAYQELNANTARILETAIKLKRKLRKRSMNNYPKSKRLRQMARKRSSKTCCLRSSRRILRCTSMRRKSRQRVGCV